MNRSKQTEPAPAPPSGHPTWECFRDDAYYGMSCVRRIGEREFGRGFHVSTLDEAEELTRILNQLTHSPIRASGFTAPNGSRWADAEEAFRFFFEENRINSDALNAVVKELNAIKANNARLTGDPAIAPEPRKETDNTATENPDSQGAETRSGPATGYQPAAQRIPCPNCYGGHFRPCHICGDSGVALWIPPADEVAERRAQQKGNE